MHSMPAPTAWQVRTQLVEAAELVRRRRQHAPPERDVSRRLDVRARHCVRARPSASRRAAVRGPRAQHAASRRKGCGEQKNGLISGWTFIVYLAMRHLFSYALYTTR